MTQVTVIGLRGDGVERLEEGGRVDASTTATLHPQCVALLEAIAARGEATVDDVSPTQARDAYRSRAGLVQPAAPLVAGVSDVEIRVGARRLGLRLYRPMGVEDGAYLPALVYLHGGGWLLGSVDTHDTLCRELCNASGVNVISVDYRLAPEHPYPAALDDARAALNWVFEHAAEAGIDAGRIAIGGDSAGANLAAALSIEMRDMEGRELAFQLLIYPAVDLRCNSDSFRRNGEGLVLTHRLMTYFVRQYAQAADLMDWRLSPALSESLDRLPPTLVVVAGFDPLHDEGVAYAQRLSGSGVPTTLLNFERQIHGFITMGKVIDEANDAVMICAAKIRQALRSDT